MEEPFIVCGLWSFGLVMFKFKNIGRVTPVLLQIPGCTLCDIFYHFFFSLYFSWLECSLNPEISGGRCQYAKFGIACVKLSSLRPLWVIIQKKYKFANQKKILKSFMDVVMHDIYIISLQNSSIWGKPSCFLKKEQNVYVYIVLLFFCYVILLHFFYQENIHKLLFLL